VKVNLSSLRYPGVAAPLFWATMSGPAQSQQADESARSPRCVRAATGNMKKVTVELGGKSPAIVMEDANLETAIPGAASAIFFNQGRVCCAGRPI
jgi:hypothetical protein